MDNEQEAELRRETAIRDAVTAADRIIMERSNGSVEETNYLTARVAYQLLKKALLPFTSAMLRVDIERRAAARKRGDAL